jgi:hypothetical protein
MVRRALALAGFGAVLATAGCSGGIFAGQPSPSPVTVASVQTALDSSTMQSAHFRLTGTVALNSYRFDVTGDGVLQRTPFAMSMNMTLPLRGAPTFHAIIIGGLMYTREGSGKWTSTLERSTASPTAPTSYVGEERVGGELAWHIQSKDSEFIYDGWVRESDGYFVYLKVDNSTITVSLAFDKFNNSPVITAPK